MSETAESWDMPEDTPSQIIAKISRLAWDIRCDWTDPRNECRAIGRLCVQLRGTLGVEAYHQENDNE